jgi:hypothetical protein
VVAETHTHRDAPSAAEVLEFLADASGIADLPDRAGELTVAACGFEGELGIDDLLGLLGEEYGERTISPDVDDDHEELHDRLTAAAFVEWWLDGL